MVRQMGCRIEGGKAVKDLLIEGGRCRGVVLEGGERMEGYDLVIVAMGSWCVRSRTSASAAEGGDSKEQTR
jgi:glycine/D-amino acid oxidase-like deaminating enzyme